MKLNFLLVSLLLLSCRTERAFEKRDLDGEWVQLVDGESVEKAIVLHKDGVAEFRGLTLQDLGDDDPGVVPPKGIWLLEPGSQFVGIWFEYNGGDFGEGARVVETKEGLELWFSKGDPDEFLWRKFRLLER